MHIMIFFLYYSFYWIGIKVVPYLHNFTYFTYFNTLEKSRDSGSQDKLPYWRVFDINIIFFLLERKRFHGTISSYFSPVIQIRILFYTSLKEERYLLIIFQIQSIL